jgi:plastocyanin
MIGCLLASLFALVLCVGLMKPALGAPSAKVTVAGLATGKAEMIAAGNLPGEAVPQQAAASGETDGGAKVSIVNFAFTPEEITIAPGESVTWSNDDGAPHGLVYQDGATGTDLLLPGASFSRRFDRPGTYDYSCAVHPYMTGRVVARAQ